MIEEGDYVSFYTQHVGPGFRGWVNGAGYVKSCVGDRLIVDTDRGVFDVEYDEATLVCKQYRLDV